MKQLYFLKKNFIAPLLNLIISLTLAIASTTSLASSQGLQDVSYQFDNSKLAAANDSFHFLRSFVDLFYLVYSANQKNFKTWSNLTAQQGWCVGDAHPENFGVLLQENQRPLFTMNDMDDSGPCPIALDLLRLMTSSRLYDDTLHLEKIMDAYIAGLNNDQYPAPTSIQDLLAKASKKGILPNAKKVSGNQLVRDAQMTELSAQEKNQILEVLQFYKGILDPNITLLDAVATSKVGGGSGGLLRYEVLLNNGGTLLHLEFKEQVTPAIYPVSQNLPTTAKRIASTIAVDQGTGASRLYKVIQMNNKDFLIRPRFAGNVGISLDQQSGSENKDIIKYEAYVLGLIHSHSIQNTKDWKKQLSLIQKNDLENDVTLMTDYFHKKYNSLSSNNKSLRR